MNEAQANIRVFLSIGIKYSKLEHARGGLNGLSGIDIGVVISNVLKLNDL